MLGRRAWNQKSELVFEIPVCAAASERERAGFGSAAGGEAWLRRAVGNLLVLGYAPSCGLRPINLSSEPVPGPSPKTLNGHSRLSSGHSSVAVTLNWLFSKQPEHASPANYCSPAGFLIRIRGGGASSFRV